MRKVAKGIDYEIYVHDLTVWQSLKKEWSQTIIYSCEDSYADQERGVRERFDGFKRGRYDIVI